MNAREVCLGHHELDGSDLRVVVVVTPGVLMLDITVGATVWPPLEGSACLPRYVSLERSDTRRLLSFSKLPDRGHTFNSQLTSRTFRHDAQCVMSRCFTGVVRKRKACSFTSLRIRDTTGGFHVQESFSPVSRRLVNGVSPVGRRTVVRFPTVLKPSECSNHTTLLPGPVFTECFTPTDP